MRTSNGSIICVDAFWDTAALRRRLAAACPQVHIQECCAPDWIHSSRHIVPPKRNNYRKGQQSAGTFRNLTRSLLADSGMADIGSRNPVLLAYRDVFLG